MAMEIYDLKESRVGEERMRIFERFLMLRVIDDEWKDHLYEMDMLKEGIHLRAYGQKDPLIEYKRESFLMFESLINRINEKTLNILWKFKVQEDPEPHRRRMPTQRSAHGSRKCGKSGIRLCRRIRYSDVLPVNGVRNNNRCVLNKKLVVMILVHVGAEKNIKSVVGLFNKLQKWTTTL